jgi:hypothetical protein
MIRSHAPFYGKRFIGDKKQKIVHYTSDYEQTKEYFIKRRKHLPIKTTCDDIIYSDSYPIIQIKFNKDDIVIGELRENGILQDKFLFTGEGRVTKKTLGLKNYEVIKTPTVIFPNGDRFPT